MKIPATTFENKIVPTVNIAMFIHCGFLLTIILPHFLKIFIDYLSLSNTPSFAVATETTDFADYTDLYQ